MSISTGMCWASGGVLVTMMILTVINVVARPFNMAPIGIPEMIGYGMVVVVCFGFAYNALFKGNIAVNIVFVLFSKRLQALIAVLIDLIGLGFFICITWQGVVTAVEEYEVGDLSPVLGFPVTPFRACMIFGFGMLCIVLLLDLMKSIVGVVKK